MLLTYPLAIAAFYRRLVAAFGGRFVLMVFAIYGLSQGIGQSFAYYAQKYLFTDDVPEGFGRTAAAYQAYDGLSMFPWSCKALYGLVSDTVPIGGRNRTPYVEIAGVLSLAAFAGLAATGPAGTPLIACLLMLVANLSMAVPDVMLDAVVAGHCRTHPKLASDLQVGAPCTRHAHAMLTPCTQHTNHTPSCTRRSGAVLELARPRHHGRLCRQGRPPQRRGRARALRCLRGHRRRGLRRGVARLAGRRAYRARRAPRREPRRAPPRRGRRAARRVRRRAPPRARGRLHRPLPTGAGRDGVRAHAGRHRRGHHRRARLRDARLRCRHLRGGGGQLLVARAVRLACTRLASTLTLRPTPLTHPTGTPTPVNPTTLIPTSLALPRLPPGASPHHCSPQARLANTRQGLDVHLPRCRA